MANPKFGAQNASMFICGDDGNAKATVGKLAEELGFEAVDVGPRLLLLRAQGRRALCGPGTGPRAGDFRPATG